MLKTIITILALAAATPAAAQIIIEDEPIDGDGGGAGGIIFPCEDCCRLNPAWYCEGEYGCDCGDFGFCGAGGAMRASGMSASAQSALHTSMATAGTQLLGPRGGRQVIRLWIKYDETVSTVLRANPALQQRVGKALAAYWPSEVDFTAPAPATGTPRVSKEGLAEVRAILGAVATAAEGEDDGLPRLIRTQVLPRLGDGLIGRPYPEALGCFADGC